MNALHVDVWKWIALACFAWYAAVTAWVAVRGFVDIRRMLARLAAEQRADRSLLGSQLSPRDPRGDGRRSDGDL